MANSSDPKKYLATEILSEQITVSYRSVARALKVHVNTAKLVLYEFYETQNKKKPGSVHATYLLCGMKKRLQAAPKTNGHTKGAQHGEDVHMPSSPPPFTSSMLEPSEHGSQAETEERLETPVKVITLVREESLEEVAEQYETVTSLHIYSLSPHRIQDLVSLTDIGRALYTDVFTKEDPLVHNKAYGVIQNPDVRRKKGKRRIILDAPAQKFKAVKEEPKTSTTTATNLQFQPATKKEPSRPGSAGSTTSSAAAPATTKKPTAKREAANFFKKSFGTIKPTPKLARQDTDASTNASASGAEDTRMTEAEEEGESEDDAIFLDTGTKKEGSKKRASDVTRDREDKAAKLRKAMMDSDDDEEAPSKADEEIKAEPSAPLAVAAKKPTDEAGDVAWSDSDSEKPQAKAEDDSQASAAAVSNDEPKRLRGRRKVMKKKTTKDEDGYLVTKEEAVWESFSEDEAPAPKVGRPFGLSQQSGSQGLKSSGAVGAKGAKGKPAKGGGGNIMSFFGKK